MNRKNKELLDRLYDKAVRPGWINEDDILAYEFYRGVPDWRGIVLHMRDGRCILYNDILSSYILAKDIFDLDEKYHGTPSDDEDFRVQLSRRLFEIFSLSGLSQDELAYKTGISAGSINYYLNGQVIPSAFNVAKLAYALGCSTDDLIGLRYKK